MKIFWLVLFLVIAVGYYFGGSVDNQPLYFPKGESNANEQRVKSPVAVTIPYAKVLKLTVPNQEKKNQEIVEKDEVEKKRDVEESDLIELRDSAGEVFKQQGLIE